MKFGDLRGILQYVPQFRGQLFVVAIDGAVAASENFANVLLDLAVLHSLNVKLAVVHGAGSQIRALAAVRGIEVSCADGAGPTDPATLELSIDAVSRLTNKVMQDLTAIGLRAATANAVIAHPAGIIGGIDQGATGKIDRVDAAGLASIINEGMVPVIPPLGFDGAGGTVRINSDAAAVAVAEAMSARKILFLTADQMPAADSGDALRRQLSVEEASALAGGAAGLPGRLASTLGFAARACAAGVHRVHLLDGARDEALLAELFSNEGVGTMVYRDDYRQVRPAVPGDAAEIVSLTRSAVQDEELLPRRRGDVLARIGDYFVLELDGNVVGTVAVHLHDDTAELACLFIKRSHENAGHGSGLVSFAEKTAADRGAGRIFALSTQAVGYFERVGYREGSLDELPAERAEKVRASGRRSRVFVKELG